MVLKKKITNLSRNHQIRELRSPNLSLFQNRSLNIATNIITTFLLYKIFIPL